MHFSENQDYRRFLRVAVNLYGPIFWGLDVHGGRKLKTYTYTQDNYDNPRYICMSGVKNGHHFTQLTVYTQDSVFLGLLVTPLNCDSTNFIIVGRVESSYFSQSLPVVDVSMGCKPI